MERDAIRHHIQALTHQDAAQRDAARAALLAGDEAIMDVLIEEFYAGVSVAAGDALLEVIGQIGGFMAINTLQYVHEFEPHDSWRAVAGKWLKHDGFL